MTTPRSCSPICRLVWDWTAVPESDTQACERCTLSLLWWRHTPGKLNKDCGHRTTPYMETSTTGTGSEATRKRNMQIVTIVPQHNTAWCNVRITDARRRDRGLFLSIGKVSLSEIFLVFPSLDDADTVPHLATYILHPVCLVACNCV